MSPQQKSLAEVRTAFETHRVLKCSTRELQQFLVALGAETIADAAERARAAEMGETIRQLLVSRQSRQPSRLAALAAVLALAALLSTLVQAYYFSWPATRSAADAPRNELASSTQPEEPPTDLRTHMTLAELAKRSPSIRSGNLQAWWTGEQARQVQRLEALAKRQALAGDRDGAARTIARADKIRSGLASLADYEKPPAR